MWRGAGQAALAAAAAAGALQLLLLLRARRQRRAAAAGEQAQGDGEAQAEKTEQRRLSATQQEAARALDAGAANLLSTVMQQERGVTGASSPLPMTAAADGTGADTGPGSALAEAGDNAELETLATQLPLTRVQSSMSSPIFRLVLTGGPCSGKTTATARVSSFLRERGFRVFTVPEAATMLFLNGTAFTDLSDSMNRVAFQRSVITTQLMLESNFERIARFTGAPCVLLCDRGAMDGRGYCSAEEWVQITAFTGMDTVQLREGRYHAVFHMVTAADGAEEFYTIANNAARSEDLEGAREVDRKTLSAWAGHPRHVIIDNRGDFETKLQYLVQQVGRAVGLPKLEKTTFKYLLTGTSPDWTNAFPPDLEVQHFDVEKVYLQTHVSSALHQTDSTVDYTFIRRRSQEGMHVYGITSVLRSKDGERLELKRMLTDREYAMLKSASADPSRHVVKQRRHCFIWHNQAFTIHSYTAPLENLHILHCQSDGTSPIEFPPFLSVGPPVSDDGDMSAYQVSLKKSVCSSSSSSGHS